MCLDELQPLSLNPKSSCLSQESGIPSKPHIYTYGVSLEQVKNFKYIFLWSVMSWSTSYQLHVLQSQENHWITI